MSNVIDTKSNLFKLYAARRMRTDNFGTEQRVIDADCASLNICSYTRNIALELWYRLGMFVFMVTLFTLATFMVLTPVVSTVAWLVTDNPFIVWFGAFGEVVMVADAVCVTFVIFMGISWAWNYIKNAALETARKARTPNHSYMSNLKVASTWVRSTHGKFCVPLVMDVNQPPTEAEVANDEADSK